MLVIEGGPFALGRGGLAPFFGEIELRTTARCSCLDVGDIVAVVSVGSDVLRKEGRKVKEGR
jgi:hypothetical protein